METLNPNHRVVIATSILLLFLSFWRAAALVLQHSGSSAFPRGALSEALAGKSAPWFILGVMLFYCAVSGRYLEASSLVRRGVYRVIIRSSKYPKERKSLS